MEDIREVREGALRFLCWPIVRQEFNNVYSSLVSSLAIFGFMKHQTRVHTIWKKQPRDDEECYEG